MNVKELIVREADSVEQLLADFCDGAEIPPSKTTALALLRMAARVASVTDWTRSDFEHLCAELPNYFERVRTQP